MNHSSPLLRAASFLLCGSLALSLSAVSTTALAKNETAAAPPAKAALSVTTTKAVHSNIATPLLANGNIMAWQEAIIGTELQNLRLQQVLVNVGDTVTKGQVLATFDQELITAELAQSEAAVAEAQAMLNEAAANAQRARELQPSGMISVQQSNQWLTAERAAQARLDAAKAVHKIQQVRLSKTRVLAPDHGVISARQATVGSVISPGSSTMELFRIIRQSRLEWRAEVAATELALVQTGRKVKLNVVGLTTPITGTVRQIAPSVDAATRNALVYVDVPSTPGLKAGMFARGEFETTATSALSVPQSAVLLRDGFSYVFTITANNKVRQKKIQVGRRSGLRIEVTQGLDENAAIVASGVGFLADGDTVRIVPATTQP
jgi:HlyD family secretion protein